MSFETDIVTYENGHVEGVMEFYYKITGRDNYQTFKQAIQARLSDLQFVLLKDKEIIGYSWLQNTDSFMRNSNSFRLAEQHFLDTVNLSETLLGKKILFNKAIQTLRKSKRHEEIIYMFKAKDTKEAVEIWKPFSEQLGLDFWHDHKRIKITFTTVQ